MSRVLISLLLVAPVAPLYAQNPPPADPLAGEVSLGYIATSGNTDSTSTNAAFGLKYELTRWAHEVALAAVAATTDEATTAEAYSAGYKARRTFDETRSYLFTTADWRKDRFSTFESVLSETVGYGRRLIDSGPHLFNAEIGAGARQARLIDDTDQNDAILRAAIGYQLRLSELTGFTQDLIIEAGESNTSTEAISAVRARLIGRVGLVLSYRVKNNSDVLPGTEPTDRFTSIALEYAF